MEKTISHESGQNPLVYLFRKTWYYSEGNRKNIALFWVMFIIANTISLFAEPLLWANIINTVTTQGVTEQNIRTLFGLLAAIILVNVVFWALHGPARILERTNAFIARAKYRKRLLQGVMNLPLEWHSNHHSGDSIDKIGRGTGGLYSFSKETFEILNSVVRLLVSYAMLVYFSPSSLYIVLGMMIVTVWTTMRFDKVIIAQYKDLNQSENNISESVFDTISNITTVTILRVERFVFKAIANKIDKPFALFKKSSKTNEWKWFLTTMCCRFMTAMVLAAYFLQHMNSSKAIMAGSLYLLIDYLGKISDLFFKFTGMYGEILGQKAQVMNSEELTKDFSEENLSNHVLPKDWQQLEIRGLNFSYPDVDEGILHLDDISLSIAKGENIAFVGLTGSGKTTLLKVIRDLYHPQTLDLRVDGTPIPHGFNGIHKAIALVPQQAEILAMTILENITMGAVYDMDFIRRYTDMACVTKVVEKLPRTFETSMKEKGVNLSVGQLQRLALARGLLACHDKDIVLLDEPTSSLDPETEMQVYENILREFESKTVISTIHRLHLLPLFEKIYFFSEGKIVGSGTLNKLVSSNKAFRTMWQKGQVAVT